ncbi:putative DnaJ-like protein subfamily C member 9 [Hypsibius exemplaris]|uniref:DnaJ-like protein subfamily C member 9 n=1 Tax=Hypsibius exemplaris TaxID=2072580 RepID=A0A1W0WRR1_HYPEX|nr:putative DnaJ-like protein subfamily C member 9 [Hypsibius exemplaris]
MGTLKKEMKKYFATENLYELLMVTKTANEEEIKKAYRKLSLTIHPDRVADGEKETATIKFQILGKVHSVLSDKKKRDVYDETGIADDDLISDKVSDWTKYFDSIFKTVELADIQAFEKEYIGSDEEKDDIKKLYLRFKGNMNIIMEHLMFYQFDHEDRYRAVLTDLIRKKEVPDYPIYTAEPAKSVADRRKKCEAEAKAAEKAAAKLKKKNGAGDGMDLLKMIQDRQKNRMGNLIDTIANRHGVKLAADEDEASDDDGDWEGLSGDDVRKSDEEDSEGAEEDDEDGPAETARPASSRPKRGAAAATRKKQPASKSTKAPSAKRRRNN